MASNSSSCKAWCIALVSAILVLVADKNKSSLILIAFLPTALFFVLDAYYLALERAFIAAYNEFIYKLHKRKVDASDLYAITPKGNLLKRFGWALLSFSVWPLYVTLLIVIFAAQRLVFH
jgi:hypothetical protein